MKPSTEMIATVEMALADIAAGVTFTDSALICAIIDKQPCDG